MRKSLLMSVAALCLAAGPGIAQTGSTQNPPASVGAGSQMPQSPNSAPAGATSPVGPAAGNSVGTTVTQPAAMVPAPVVVAPAPVVMAPVPAPVVVAPAPVVMAPAPAPVVVAPAPVPVVVAPAPMAPTPRASAPVPAAPVVTASPPVPVAPVTAGPVTPAPVVTTAPAPRVVARPVRPVARVTRMRPQPDTMPVDASAPPTDVYRGGAGSPSSTAASNNTGADTRSEMAPRLPDPGGANSPQALLLTAMRALDRRQTGAAQEALERAETRILSRTTEPSMAGQPDSAAMVQSIGQARRALGNRDIAGARAAIQAALNAPVPPPGPAVTTTIVQPVGMVPVSR